MPRKSSLPAALYTAAQVREMDCLSIERYGIAGEELMERAGQAAFDLLRWRWPDARHILVLTGTGNNGGDGFVVARLALQAGLRVTVLQLGDRERIAGDAKTNALRYAALSGDWQPFGEALPRDTDLIVDAVFGTGLERNVDGRWAEALKAVNALRVPVLALDIPSGLHSDTGKILGTAVRADATVSFIGLKQGMFTADGPGCCGDVYFEALDVPAQVYASQILSARRLDWQRQKQLLQPRSRTAHKGQFGHVLVVGGDLGYGGAARLCAEAALRSGAGLVSLATRPGHVCPALAARPEIMAHGVESPVDLLSLTGRASVVALGSGLGKSDWGQALWQVLIDTELPLIADADALNLLAESPRSYDKRILTPHPGEAARLLKCTTEEINTDRFRAVERLQRRYGGVAVLKGAGTLVLDGGNRPTAVCTDGNPGMASGGMGDVLTGVIAGLVAQGWDLAHAAELGVCLHAAAADKAARAGERGLLASDLMSHIRRLANPENE
ncbi:NAD(P)H-hydrate dehydratase [Thiolapillus sp.]|uniref:NAD(P)H-hydrate dehydratase n=1 Tax=Thiolapillus sp. TaxID=2017437 RepID=UPI003AF51E67